jgi:hypothetical protein
LFDEIPVDLLLIRYQSNASSGVAPECTRKKQINGEVIMKSKFGSLVMGALIALFLNACASTEPVNPLVGAWLITIDTPIGSMDANINVNTDLTGEMTSQDLGSAPLTGVSVEGDAVRFTAAVNAQGTALTLAFTGTVEGDSLSGSFNTDFGAIPVTGRRL